MTLLLALLLAIGAPATRTPGTPAEGDAEWPSGSLAEAPFGPRPGSTGQFRSSGFSDVEGSLSYSRKRFDREEERSRAFPERILAEDFRLSLQDPPPKTAPDDPAARDAPWTPHGSFKGWFLTHGSSDAWRDDVWGHYLATPSVLLPLGLAVSALVITPWDHRLEKQWAGTLGGRQRWSNTGVYTLMGASLGIGLLFPGEGRNSWDEFWTILESNLASTIMVAGLKYSAQRLRPGYGTDSFPSGHTAYAFTAASLLESNSGPWVGIPAYALAGFTGFERVESGRHYPSDVLAGAAIGTLSAGVIDALHWGSGHKGEGIAGRTMAVQVESGGLHSFQLAVEVGF